MYDGEKALSSINHIILSDIFCRCVYLRYLSFTMNILYLIKLLVIVSSLLFQKVRIQYVENYKCRL
jgi:hypothetical protein